MGQRDAPHSAISMRALVEPVREPRPSMALTICARGMCVCGVGREVGGCGVSRIVSHIKGIRTSRPDATSPKTQCLPSKWGVATVVMKNCKVGMQQRARRVRRRRGC